MKRSKIERIGNVVAFSIAILFNYLANAIPLGGQTTGDISDLYFSMFTPTGFTFAIWGVIYLALFGFIVRQLQGRESGSSVLARIRFYFVINCLSNALWILMWHYDQLILSMFFMVLILFTLFRINQIISSDSSLDNGWNYLLIAFPFHIYFGWISVATIANISVLQFVFGLNDFLISQQSWTILKLIAAGILVYVWGWRPARPAYIFVISWAAFGISVANSNQLVIESAARALAAAAFIAGMLLVLRHSTSYKRLLRTRTTG